MNLGNLILTIIPDIYGNLMNLFTTLFTEPHEAILFIGSPLPFKDNKPGILRYPGRMWRPSRAKEDLAGADNGDFTPAFRSDVVKVLLPSQLQRYLVTRVDMEIPSLLAASA